MLHPQAAAALELWAQGPDVTDRSFTHDDLVKLRADAAADAAEEEREEVARVVDLSAGGVPSRLYLPTDASTHGVLVYVHGGGFVLGGLDTHDAHARRLAHATGLAVLLPDYRLAPEHPYPAAVEDADAALDWVLSSAEAASLGLDPARVAVAGDSAGGTLALVAAWHHPGRVRALVLVYPFLDPRCGGASYASETGGLTRSEALWYAAQYAASDADLTDVDFAPLLAADHWFEQMREAVLVQIAGEDVLVDENRELVRRLESAGVDIASRTYDGMVHGFWRQPALFDAADEALADVASFLRSHLGPRPGHPTSGIA